jgi:hypothetical protein
MAYDDSGIRPKVHVKQVEIYTTACTCFDSMNKKYCVNKIL